MSNGPSTATGSKSSSTMNFRQGRIAADMPLARRVQHLGIGHSDYEPQVEIAIGDPLDVAAAHVAQIAFFALGHAFTPQKDEKRCGTTSVETSILTQHAALLTPHF